MLLVGGASERFGSPKAQALFRGETLADRAWRLLHSVCEEVLAVGKADGVELAFPVLDDGVAEHAPIFGLIVGLRAAENDLCLALPVDCPLVTPEALRALAAARAIPQTGPLPGAYPQAALGELEARVARRELSLRGVNPTLLELDPALLVNVNTRIDLLLAAITDWARERDDVRAAVVVGSQVRTDRPADRWSDLDIVLVVDEPSRLLEDAEWVREFGTPVLTFVEPMAVGDGRERRVLYETGEDVDLSLVDVASWRGVASQPGPRRVLARGHRVLYDDVGLELPASTELADEEPLPDGAAVRELASDFWYHALWAAKKLRRGEVFTAIGCVDGYLKARLVTLLGWHARLADPALDTWHGGRFLERWADPGALAALERAYAHYDVRDVARALWETIDLFQGVEEEVTRRLELDTVLDHPDLRRRIGEVVPDVRGGRSHFE